MSDLTNVLQHESEKYPALPSDMIERVAKRVQRRQRNRKVAAIGVALAISLASVTLLIRGFGHGEVGPATKTAQPTSSPSPASTLTIFDVRWIGASPLWKVYGTVTNSGASATGASYTCFLLEGTGVTSPPGSGGIQYLKPGHSAQALVGIEYSGHPASARCTVTPQVAVSPSPKPPAKPLFYPAEIAFFDSLHGILVGQIGQSCYGVTCRGVIETTTDGGATWQVRARFAKPVVSVTISGTEAWATLGGCSKCTFSSGLLHSMDGGRTWTLVSSADVGAPSFATPTRGWALLIFADGGNGVSDTADGGRTWSEPSDPCRKTAGGLVAGVAAASATHLFLACAGQPGAGNQDKGFLESFDAGRTWIKRDQTGSLGGSGYFKGMFFLSDGHGWLWMDRGSFYATSDGGAFWHVQGHVLVPDVNWMGSAWFVSPYEGFATISEHHWQLIHTTDAGLTWRVVYTWQSHA